MSYYNLKKEDGMTPVTKEDIVLHLEAMDRSLNALIFPLTFDTRRLANNNLAHCQRWLKQRGIIYYYDGKNKKFRIKEEFMYDSSQHAQENVQQD